MSTHLEEQLRSSLHQHARTGGIGGQPTGRDVDDVLQRAGRIRRRRRTVAAAGTALAVLAIAAPIGIWSADQPGDRPDSSIVATGPDSQQDPTPIAEPIVLSAEVPVGDAPGLPWWDAEALHLPGGTEVPVSHDYSRVQVVGDRVLAGRYDEDAGEELLDDLALDGTIRSSSPYYGSLAVNGDSSTAAWLTPDGEVRLMGPEGLVETDVSLPYANLVTLTGPSGCATDCTLWYDESEIAGITLDTQEKVRFTRIFDIHDVSEDGMVVGTTSVNEPSAGSCSAAFRGEDEVWSTCDYSPDTLSPDGRWMSATDALRDGIGQATVAILDTRTGEPLVEYRAPDGSFVNYWLWEDAEHVLTVLYDEQVGRWEVLRLGLDGSVESTGVRHDGSWDTLPIRLTE